MIQECKKFVQSLNYSLFLCNDVKKHVLLKKTKKITASLYEKRDEKKIDVFNIQIKDLSKNVGVFFVDYEGLNKHITINGVFRYGKNSDDIKDECNIFTSSLEVYRRIFARFSFPTSELSQFINIKQNKNNFDEDSTQKLQSTNLFEQYNFDVFMSKEWCQNLYIGLETFWTDKNYGLKLNRELAGKLIKRDKIMKVLVNYICLYGTCDLEKNADFIITRHYRCNDKNCQKGNCVGNICVCNSFSIDSCSFFHCSGEKHCSNRGLCLSIKNITNICLCNNKYAGVKCEHKCDDLCNNGKRDLENKTTFRRKRKILNYRSDKLSVCNTLNCINGLCNNNRCVCTPHAIGIVCKSSVCTGSYLCDSFGYCTDVNIVSLRDCKCGEIVYGNYCTSLCIKDCIFGVCQIVNNTKKCACVSGYEGEYCDIIVEKSNEAVKLVVIICLSVLLALCISILVIVTIYCVKKSKKLDEITRELTMS